MHQVNGVELRQNLCTALQDMKEPNKTRLPMSIRPRPGRGRKAVEIGRGFTWAHMANMCLHLQPRLSLFVCSPTWEFETVGVAHTLLSATTGSQPWPARRLLGLPQKLRKRANHVHPPEVGRWSCAHSLLAGGLRVQVVLRQRLQDKL